MAKVIESAGDPGPRAPSGELTQHRSVRQAHKPETIEPALTVTTAPLPKQLHISEELAYSASPKPENLPLSDVRCGFCHGGVSSRIAGTYAWYECQSCGRRLTSEVQLYVSGGSRNDLSTS